MVSDLNLASVSAADIEFSFSRSMLSSKCIKLSISDKGGHDLRVILNKNFNVILLARRF